MDSWTEKYFESFMNETISFPGNHIELISGFLENGYMYSAWNRSFIGNFYIKGYIVTKRSFKHSENSIGKYYMDYARFSGGWNDGNRMNCFNTLERSDLEWFLCRMMQGALQ